MFIYEKKVENKNKLFRTKSNVPTEADDELTYVDGTGEEVTDIEDYKFIYSKGKKLFAGKSKRQIPEKSDLTMTVWAGEDCVLGDPEDSPEPELEINWFSAVDSFIPGESLANYNLDYPSYRVTSIAPVAGNKLKIILDEEEYICTDIKQESHTGLWYVGADLTFTEPTRVRPIDSPWHIDFTNYPFTLVADFNGTLVCITKTAGEHKISAQILSIDQPVLTLNITAIDPPAQYGQLEYFTIEDDQIKYKTAHIDKIGQYKFKAVNQCYYDRELGILDFAGVIYIVHNSDGEVTSNSEYYKYNDGNTGFFINNNIEADGYIYAGK